MKQIDKKLPVDIQSFETMQTENYLYVDKTRYIHRMVTEGKFYFLSRPRRFGKSLLVSTLQCLFQGKKELFKGLWIAEQAPWAWQKHPVITIDFNEIPGATPEQLQHYLSQQLIDIGERAAFDSKADLPEILFKKLILHLHEQTGKSVVVLIDEYDKRIIDHLGKGPQRLEIARGNRDVLKSFFGILKGQSISSKLRLVFLTGVSRFSKVSLFSDLNNLQDISMSERYVEMLGYTQEELESCFEEHIARLAHKFGWSRSQVIDALARKYNGYRFSHSPVLVYNPFSILNAFHNQELGDYWFESATPTFLVDYLRHKQYNLPKIESLEVSRTIFSNFDIERLHPEALLFQTGYLTIKEVRNGIYTLDYPNQEVKSAFTEALLFSLAEEGSPEVSSLVLQLPGYLNEEDFEAFFETMRAIFASIPYDIESKRDEAYFHTIFYLMMSASGLVDAQSSVLTSKGRIDLAVIFPEKIYIIEFKCNQNAETALRQIRDKHYAEKYRRSGKQIILMGINFNQQQRNLEEWKIQPDND
ncbi:MAG: ATP-binding protein [bacterium]|nr:ATP-binding protein [bacterium]